MSADDEHKTALKGDYPLCFYRYYNQLKLNKSANKLIKILVGKPDEKGGWLREIKNSNFDNGKP